MKNKNKMPKNPTGNHTLDTIANAFCWEQRQETNGILYEGTHPTADSGVIYDFLSQQSAGRIGWFEQSAWADGWFRRVWVSPLRWAILTYCEGDICLFVGSDEQHFQEEIKRCEAFYNAKYTESVE